LWHSQRRNSGKGELALPGLKPSQRGMRLLDVAGPQVEALLKTARGSHQGAPAGK
jgi:hypothetical protein